SANQPDTPTLVQAVNAGGDAFVAANGVQYEADTFNTGRTFSTTADIGGTADDGLYQTEAWAKSLSYEMAVANGTYDLELNFAEIWGGAQQAGVRVLDIFVEDQLIFNDLDLSSDVGFREALDLVGEVTVTDGSLSIEVAGDVQNGKLAGFAIWEAEGNLTDAFEVGSLYDDISFA
ncbi:MAG: malectin domain-containing carbohydrate-binding protein, partial [Pseudomonadota bacterium]